MTTPDTNPNELHPQADDFRTRELKRIADGYRLLIAHPCATREQRIENEIKLAEVLALLER